MEKFFKKIETGKDVADCLEHLNDLLQEGHEASKQERDRLMSVLAKTAKSNDMEIKQSSFFVLSSFILANYKHLKDYFPSVLKVTIDAINNFKDTSTGKFAIEFFSTLAEEESALEEEENSLSKGYIKQALPLLLPALLLALTQQDEDDEFSLATASGSCISLILEFLGEIEINEIAKFLEINLRSPNWRNREAAAMALGASVSVLPENIAAKEIGLVQKIAKEGENELERETAVWALAKCGETHFSLISESMITDLASCLSAPSKVVGKACYALYTIAKQTADENNNTLLAPLISCVPQLLAATKDTHNAYESLNEIIAAIPEDDERRLSLAAQLIPEYMTHLKNFKSKEGNLLGAIQTCLLIMPAESVRPISNEIINSILSIVSRKDATLLGEVLLLITCLATALKQDFLPYMPKLHPIILDTIQNTTDSETYNIAITAVSEVATAIESEFIPYSKFYVPVLISHVRKNPRQFDPQIIGNIIEIISDCATVLKKEFSPYTKQALDAALAVVESAGFNEHLRSGFFILCTGIIQVEVDNVISTYIEKIIKIVSDSISHYFSDKSTSENAPLYLNNAVSLLGDISQRLGSTTKQMMNKVTPLLVKVVNNVKDPETIDRASMSLKFIKQQQEM